MAGIECVADQVSDGVPSMSDDGTIHTQSMMVPPSAYMSDGARRAYAKMVRRTLENASAKAGAEPTLEEQRKETDAYYQPLVERAEALHPVAIQRERIAGVHVDVVEPQGGAAHENRHRLLISLHGGSFSYSAAGQARLLEAITVAGFGRIRVVSVDYRTSPDFHYPAAVDDVVSVYKEMLKSYPPKNVGLYGCSTGAALTGMVEARIQKEGLPRPGAIGLFCEGAIRDDQLEGDSLYIGRALMGGKPPAIGADLVNAYMKNTSDRDPLVAPVGSLGVLSKFPPTLLLSGSRDMCLSGVLYTHARLVEAGVEAELHVWDGMWHGFILDVDLPESTQAYRVITKFFDLHLGKSGSLKRS
jgi:acetyl esterase/lipase